MLHRKLGSSVLGLLKSESLFLFGCSDKFASPVCPSIHNTKYYYYYTFFFGDAKVLEEECT